MPTTPRRQPAEGATTLHTAVTGSPADGAVPTLVLLHGVFMDSSLWDRVLPLLPGTHAIRLDMPSHGGSPDMELGASLDDHVTAVAETLDAMGVQGAVVAGHSWGGMVALRLAGRRPDLFSGLVLSNTPLLRVRGATRVGFHTQRLLLAMGFSAGLYGRIAAGALMGSAHRAAHPDDVTALAGRADRMGRRRLRETVRSVLLEPEDAMGLLRSVAVPWTVVAGDADYVLTGGVREALGATGRLHVTSGGHTTPLEDPAAVATAIRSVCPARPVPDAADAVGDVADQESHRRA